MTTHHYLGFDIPVDLMRLTGGGPETFDVISKGHMAHLAREVGIQPNHSVLEIGCGIGRDAIPLTRILTEGKYLGVDIIEPSIRWCRENITASHPNFRFIHFDVKDDLHNPGGTQATSGIRLPIPDGSVDRIIAQSVFTHMYAPDILHYFREFRRVLKRGGRTYLTCFIFDDAVLESARRKYAPGEGLRFDHVIDEHCRFNDPAHQLGAIAYTRERIEGLVRGAGLRFAKPVRPGAWSGHYSEPADGQDVLVLARPTLLGSIRNALRL